MLVRALAAALGCAALLGAATPTAGAAPGIAVEPSTAQQSATRPAAPAAQAATYEYYRYTTRFGTGHFLVQFRGPRLSVAIPGEYACLSGDRVASGTWRGYRVSGDGLDSGSITSAATVRRSAGGGQLSYSDRYGTVRGTRTSSASVARELREMFIDQTPAQVAAWCSGERAEPRARAVSGGDRLSVTVEPASSAFAWQVAVQRRGSDGRWRTRTTISLRLRFRADAWLGHTRTLDLPRGTYRAVVTGVTGFPGGASRPATLTR